MVSPLGMTHTTAGLTESRETHELRECPGETSGAAHVEMLPTLGDKAELPVGCAEVTYLRPGPRTESCLRSGQLPRPAPSQAAVAALGPGPPSEVHFSVPFSRSKSRALLAPAARRPSLLLNPAHARAQAGGGTHVSSPEGPRLSLP